MGEDLYRLVSTGLLGAIVLLLLLAISQLSRLHTALQAKPDVHRDEPGEDRSAIPEETPSEVAPTATTGAGAAVADTGPAGAGTTAPPDEEGPFERDGRWWFRRDGELLVYDERLEQWVDPAAPAPVAEAVPAEAGTPQSEPVPGIEATPEPSPTPHALDEARAWTDEHAGDARADVGQPVTQVAPIVEPVSAPAPITEVGPDGGEQSESAGEGAMTHWKCPACGVINGSTASSCRMCFAARP